MMCALRDCPNAVGVQGGLDCLWGTLIVGNELEEHELSWVCGTPPEVDRELYHSRHPDGSKKNKNLLDDRFQLRLKGLVLYFELRVVHAYLPNAFPSTRTAFGEATI